MKIIEVRGELTNKDKYDMLLAGNSEKMLNARDIVRIDKYIIAEDTGENGEPVDVLMVKAEDGIVYGTISKTFIEKFKECVDAFGEEFTAFSVKECESKAGRSYITCVYED